MTPTKVSTLEIIELVKSKKSRARHTSWRLTKCSGRSTYLIMWKF